jgi:uncharacterized membrane protein YfcA
MEVALGFVIAIAIALTGVGAGSLTTPLLILVCGLTARESVGTALLFVAGVKLLTVPFYWARGQVDRRALLYLLAGGLPGVFAGALLLRGLQGNAMMAILGFTIMLVALANLLRFSPKPRRDRTSWLTAIALPIGAEVGFSSAGSGALGALALFSLTPLAAAEVVGTDLMFGLALALAGGGVHASLGNFNGAVLVKLLAGGAIGALTGTALSSRIPARPLRLALLVVMAILGAQIAWKGLGLGL